MTTPAAARLYEAQHLFDMEGRRIAHYNPHNQPLSVLPVIYGFNNGGSPGWYHAVALAEDGSVLGGHICSSEGYILHDLGILEGTREDHHVNYKAHYPGGYRMEFVPSRSIEGHEGLNKAFANNHEKAKEESSDGK